MEKLEKLKAFLAESPNDPFLHYAIATEHLKNGALEKGRIKFEYLIENHPSYVGTYYHLGQLYERLNQTENALNTYQQGMKVAQAQNDHHSLNELQGVFNLLNENN